MIPSFPVESPPQRRQAAFTLRDLMTVIAVLGLLATLASAAISNSSRQGQDLVCRNNLRQLNLAWVQYAEDFAGALMANNDGGMTLPNWVTGWVDFSSAPDNTNIANLINPSRALMGRYVQNPALFHCPLDLSSVSIGGKTVSRVRSYSMNCWLGSQSGWAGTSPGWRVNRKLSDLVNPPLDKTLVILDEREESINDGFFVIDMNGAPHGPSPNPNTLRLVDYPAYWHERGANLNFADGHVEYWLWADPRTVPTPQIGSSFPLNVPSPQNPDVGRLQRSATGPLSMR